MKVLMFEFKLSYQQAHAIHIVSLVLVDLDNVSHQRHIDRDGTRAQT